MSHSVFEKVQISHHVTRLQGSFSERVDACGMGEVDGAAGAGRTLAGNIGYCVENAGVNSAFDRGSLRTIMGRLLVLNGRNRLSC